MHHGIPSGIFQICKEESPTSAGQAFWKVATNLGKKCWKFPKLALLFLSIFAKSADACHLWRLVPF